MGNEKFSDQPCALEEYKSLINEAEDMDEINAIADLALDDENMTDSEKLLVSIAIDEKIHEEDFDGFIFELGTSYFELGFVPPKSAQAA